MAYQLITGCSHLAHRHRSWMAIVVTTVVNSCGLHASHGSPGMLDFGGESTRQEHCQPYEFLKFLMLGMVVSVAAIPEDWMLDVVVVLKPVIYTN